MLSSAKVRPSPNYCVQALRERGKGEVGHGRVMPRGMLIPKLGKGGPSVHTRLTVLLALRWIYRLAKRCIRLTVFAVSPPKSQRPIYFT